MRKTLTFGALAAACLWKAASVPANIPFARMRRRGSVGYVFVARLISTIVYLSLAVVAATTTHSLTGVFIAFFLAEIATFGVYYIADRRTGR